MRPLIVVYSIMLIVIFLLPFYSVEHYSIWKNTTSELGAQHAPFAWVMNSTFAALGLSSIVAGWSFLKGYIFHKTVLIIFGLSLILTAFYHHAPIDTTIDYNVKEDELHSLFAGITGFSFTVFAIATAFIVKHGLDRILAIAMGVLATLLSILMFVVTDFTGIWQRLIFICCFGWMIWLFRDKGELKNTALKE